MEDVEAPAIGADRIQSGLSTAALLLTLVSEGYDLQAANFAAPSLLKALAITKAQAGPLLSASLLGVLIGAAVIGPLGDRLGRKRIIVMGCLSYGLLSLLAAGATSLSGLTALRFLIGLGLGGVLPNALALASELARRGGEAAAAGMIGIGITLGGVVAGVAAAALIPHFGWQSVFIVGGVLPLLIVLLLQWILPESPAFLANLSDRTPNDDVNRLRPRGLAILFQRGAAGRTLAIWLTFASILMCVYLLSGWIPLLLNQSGFSARAAALIGAAYQAGGVLGGVLASLMLARLGWHVVALFAAMACATMAMLLWGPTASPIALTVGIAAAGFCVTGAQNAVNGAGSASYSPEIRSSGLGWALGVGRLGSVAGPLVGSLAVLLGMTEPRHLFALPLIPLVAAALAAFWLGRRFSFQEPIAVDAGELHPPPQRVAAT